MKTVLKFFSGYFFYITVLLFVLDSFVHVIYIANCMSAV